MEDFVTYEVAKKLKEKGFKFNKDYRLDRFFMANEINTPTIAQAMKWLREEKKIVFGIVPMQEIDGDYLGWCITIYEVADDGYGLSWKEELYYDSYESAALAGIEYVLDNLI